MRTLSHPTRLVGLCALLAGLPACSRTIVDLSNADLNIPPDLSDVTYSDFPPMPLLDRSGGIPLPDNAAALFGPGTTTPPEPGGPCVTEPEDGALFPRNWLRPRVRLIAGPGQNVFEIRVRAPNQTGELVSYTTNGDWLMPLDVWANLAMHSIDLPIRLSVRAAQITDGKLVGAPLKGFEGTFTIAPVKAEGNIVYWTTAAQSALKGFSPGLETVRPVYTPDKANAACLGCHSSTPDGLYVAMAVTDTPNDLAPARIDLRTSDGKGTRPAFLSASALTLLSRVNQQAPTFSKAHWQDGDRTVLSMLPLGANKSYEMIWTDLETKSTAEGTGWGVFARTGDSRQAAAGSISHDGRTVIYVSSDDSGFGVSASNGDIRTIPYNDRKGGASTPLPGASDPQHNEYYPTFSPDDQMVVFNRVPNGENGYDNPKAEVYVLPLTGSQVPVRVRANDTPQCMNRKSPGITNSWPKWAPEVARASNQRRFYWITFSSRRSTSQKPQLYMAPVLVDGEGKITTYPALYLWNQPQGEANHTPAWDLFQLILG